MAKIVQRPILELETHELVSLSKTVNLLKEIAKNEEMRDWYELNVDHNLMTTIENLDTLLNSITID